MESKIINYLQPSIRKKLVSRLIIILVLLAFVCAALYTPFDYFVLKKVVTLNPTTGTTIVIGTLDSKNNLKKIIKTTSTKKNIRLHNGNYAVKYLGGSDFQTTNTTITVSKSIELTTPELSFVNSKLNQLLNNEKATIEQEALASFNSAGYQITDEYLYKQGEWCGIRLIPAAWYDPSVPADFVPRPTNDNNTQDILKVILNKQNGRWVVAAQPSVVFWIDNYPSIPQEIIQAVNKLGF